MEHTEALRPQTDKPTAHHAKAITPQRGIVNRTLDAIFDPPKPKHWKGAHWATCIFLVVWFCPLALVYLGMSLCAKEQEEN